jgi:hypothetical protein
MNNGSSVKNQPRKVIKSKLGSTYYDLSLGDIFLAGSISQYSSPYASHPGLIFNACAISNNVLVSAPTWRLLGSLIRKIVPFFIPLSVAKCAGKILRSFKAIISRSLCWTANCIGTGLGGFLGRPGLLYLFFLGDIVLKNKKNIHKTQKKIGVHKKTLMLLGS